MLQKRWSFRENNSAFLWERSWVNLPHRTFHKSFEVLPGNRMKMQEVQACQNRQT
jgi:hypothetical protein